MTTEQKQPTLEEMIDTLDRAHIIISNSPVIGASAKNVGITLDVLADFLFGMKQERRKQVEAPKGDA